MLPIPIINLEKLRKSSSKVLRFPLYFDTFDIDTVISACGNLAPVVASSSNLGPATTRDVDAGGVTYHIVEQRRQLVNDIVEHAFL